MKRMIIIAITLVVLGAMGYFATRNSHNVSFYLMGNFSVQLSLWMLIAISFIGGWAITELWHFFSHPDRFVKSVFGKWTQFRKNRQLKKESKFEKAVLLRDSKQVKKAFRKLDASDTSVSVHLQFLEQQRFVENGETLLEFYESLKAKFPETLLVLLPYMKLACQLKNWKLTESLSNEVLEMAPEHPDAIDCLRQMYMATNNWVACVEQERELLKKFSGSLMTEQIALDHENHLQKALRQDPKCLSNWSFRYLPQKRDRRKDKLSETIGEATQLKESGNVIDACRVLKNNYERTSSLEMLGLLEIFYYESGADNIILSMIGSLHRSRQSTIPSSLLFAKLLYQNDRLDEASHVLGEISLPVVSIATPAETTQIVEKSSNPHMPKWDRTYHSLKYLIAKGKGQSDEALNESGHLLSEEALLLNIVDENL